MMRLKEFVENIPIDWFILFLIIKTEQNQQGQVFEQSHAPVDADFKAFFNDKQFAIVKQAADISTDSLRVHIIWPKMSHSAKSRACTDSCCCCCAIPCAIEVVTAVHVAP